MRTFYALKRLTRSDLGFFRYHYDQEASHQKSINLNADVFHGAMFPGLQSGTRHSVDLRLLGPVPAPEYRLQRKVIRSANSKNWRLDGEFVPDPEDVPDRFHRLAEGDYVFFGFRGDDAPSEIRILLVSLADVPAQHSALSDFWAAHGISTASMTILTRADLDNLRPKFPPGLLPLDFLLQDATKEDLELSGGPVRRTPGGKLAAPSLGPLVDRDDADAFRGDLAEIGRLGEELVASYLDDLRSAGGVTDYEWTSLDHAFAPFDFNVVWGDGTSSEIEVKTTRNDFGQPIFLSVAEALRLIEGGADYRVYRVYDLNDQGAQLREVSGLLESVVEAVEAQNDLPQGVRVRGFTLDLSVLGTGGTPIPLLAEGRSGEVERDGD